jgi:hypothetical protein
LSGFLGAIQDAEVVDLTAQLNSANASLRDASAIADSATAELAALRETTAANAAQVERKMKVLVRELKAARKAKESEEVSRAAAEASAQVRFANGFWFCRRSLTLSTDGRHMLR